MVPTPPLTILHLLAPGPVGGLESVVRALAAGHAARGHRVHVGAILERDERVHPFLQALAAAGVPVEPIVVAGRAYRRERALVAALCERLAPHAVHTHGYRPDVIDAGVARRRGIATVTTVHGFTGGGRKNRLYEWLQERAFRRFAAVAAVSRPLVDRLTAAGVPRGVVHLVPNAYAAAAAVAPRAEARMRLGLPGEGTVVGWVGRVSREKGADVFVEALARLADPSVTAAVIGDGPERAALEARAASLGLGERLRWLGTVPDAGRWYGAFDAFALTSRTEGTPIALFEAMAASVPVVATRVGGVPDVVTPGEALVVSSERPDEIADALRETLGAPDASRARAAAALARLRTVFAPDAWLDRYEQLYRSPSH